MAGTAANFRSHLTLILCMLLHGFTHAYSTMLAPLYVEMQDDLDLPGLWWVSLLVTIYIFVYCLASYPAGVLADRFNRKALLGIGLILNAVAILLMGLTRRYDVLVALSVLAGLAGTLFHPSANALATAHYPRSPGMAIGILSMGAAMGFFAGPRYAGWRAAVDGWHAPLVEAGAFGIVFGVMFLLVAKEIRKPVAATPASPRAGTSSARGDAGVAATESSNGNGEIRVSSLEPVHPPMGAALRRKMIAISLVLAGRDFTGIATISLASIYLQKALNMTVAQAGLIIGSMMLVAIVANPLAVYLSPGRRRLPVLCAMLIAGGLVVASVPWFPASYVLAVLCTFYAFHLSSYAVSEAAILERVSPVVRGRVIGLFITIAGTLAALAPFLMGAWTDSMGAGAANPRSYALPFGVLCVLHTVAAISVLLIRRLSDMPISAPVDPLTEITPATLEVAG